MDTFINIIGLASFIYLFIFGAKAFKKKITPPPTDPFLQNYIHPSVRNRQHALPHNLL